MPFVYIVRCSDGTLYTGWAVDVAARVQVHNTGRGARYTRTRRPVTLIYREELLTRAAALKRERQIKQLPREKKLALVHSPSRKQTKSLRSGQPRKLKTV